MPTGNTSPWRGLITIALLLPLALVFACTRTPRVSDATYRQAVVAFYVSLAAMQTSQDVHARKELDRLIQLVPDEAGRVGQSWVAAAATAAVR